jgi:hypothetical protein
MHMRASVTNDDRCSVIVQGIQYGKGDYSSFCKCRIYTALTIVTGLNKFACKFYKIDILQPPDMAGFISACVALALTRSVHTNTVLQHSEVLQFNKR